MCLPAPHHCGRVLCLLSARHAEAGHEEDARRLFHERKDVVYENLRDLNFEYKAGKFPEANYQAMKTSLEEEAAAILAEIARLEAAPLSAGPIGSPTKQKKGVTGAPPTTPLK
jgi:hypothetical protein